MSGPSGCGELGDERQPDALHPVEHAAEVAHVLGGERVEVVGAAVARDDEFGPGVDLEALGKDVGGWINFNTTSSSGSVGFTFTESSTWVSSEWCDATLAAGETLDTPLVFNITGAGQYTPPLEKQRGAFRYATVVNLGEEPLSINDLWVHFAAMPHWEDDALRSYTGWFHSNDEKLNR